MHKYLYSLPALFLVSNTMLVLPCQAQNQKESHTKDNKNQVLTTSFQSDFANDATVKSSLVNAESASNKQAELLSESTSDALPSNVVSVNNPNPRIPISSRIFPASSMQQ